MKFDELNNISEQNRLKFKRQAPSHLNCTQAVAQGRNLALGPARASSLLKLSLAASFAGGAFCEILAKRAKFRDKFQACKALKFKIEASRLARALQ